MATIEKRVPVDRTGTYAREFSDTVALELQEDGTVISTDADPVALTRAILTLTDEYGAETVIDSGDAGWGAGEAFEWSSSTSVLSIRPGSMLPAPGEYAAELDVTDGSDWWRWTLEDSLTLVGE